MNKSDLIAQVAKGAGLTHEQAGKAIDAMVDTIQKTLASGDPVALVGFGAFSVAARAARTGRNPQTGEPLQIPASRVPQFKPGQTLKAAVAIKAAETPKETVAAKVAEPPKAVAATKVAEPPNSKKNEKKKK